MGKFRTKETAVVIYLGAALILGLITPVIYEVSTYILKKVPFLSIIGFFIVIANFIINQSVPTWRHTTPKTLLIYAVGIILMIVGIIVSF